MQELTDDNDVRQQRAVYRHDVRDRRQAAPPDSQPNMNIADNLMGALCRQNQFGEQQVEQKHEQRNAHKPCQTDQESRLGERERNAVDTDADHGADEYGDGVIELPIAQ